MGGGADVRCLKRNKKPFWYCRFAGKTDLTDEYGNITGEKLVTYQPAVRMEANISQATGQSNIEQFGNLENYDKVIVTDDLSCPIDENTVLFIDKAPEYSVAGVPLYDYVVRRVAKSLNSISIAVRKLSVG